MGPFLAGVPFELGEEPGPATSASTHLQTPASCLSHGVGPGGAFILSSLPSRPAELWHSSPYTGASNGSSFQSPREAEPG